jgi:hypothetical protein
MLPSPHSSIQFSFFSDTSTLNGEPPLLPPEAIENIYKEHHLPLPLQAMDEIDRMGLAYAHEVRNVVQDEVNIAERHYRQTLIMARIYYLRYQRAQDKLQHLQQKLGVLVDVALRDVSNPVSPNFNDSSELESPPSV